MAHTDKDTPYRVRLDKVEYHDHTTGTCTLGLDNVITRRELRQHSSWTHGTCAKREFVTTTCTKADAKARGLAATAWKRGSSGCWLTKCGNETHTTGHDTCDGHWHSIKTPAVYPSPIEGRDPVTTYTTVAIERCDTPIHTGCLGHTKRTWNPNTPCECDHWVIETCSLDPNFDQWRNANREKGKGDHINWDTPKSRRYATKTATKAAIREGLAEYLA